MISSTIDHGGVSPSILTYQGIEVTGEIRMLVYSCLYQTAAKLQRLNYSDKTMDAPRPILILQLRPENEISDSEYQSILRYGQLDASRAKRLRIEQSGIPEDVSLDDYSAIIVGGSPFDISTPALQKSEIQHKIEADFGHLLDRVMARDFPFLGCCSGNGLLGSYLGTPISKRFGEAVGCVPVTLTDEGKKDKLLRDFPDNIDVLLGHKEACDRVPDGAKLLIRGSGCPVQMFRVKENIYATQFHPEGDGEEFTRRIHAYKHHGYFEPREAEKLIHAVNEKPTPWSHEILRRFVITYSSY